MFDWNSIETRNYCEISILCHVQKHLGNPDGHVKHGSSPVVLPFVNDGQYSKLLQFHVLDVLVQLARIALVKTLLCYTCFLNSKN